MIKNEERVGVVMSVGMNGEGVLKDEDKIVFVPFALPEEKIRYKVLKVTKACAFGKVLEVITPAEERIREACPVFGKCGGCQLQHVRYGKQLDIKEQNVKTCFRKIANINVDVHKTVKGDGEFRYRNKLQLPVVEKDNKTVIGFYANNSHRVVEISDCLINGNWVKGIIEAFKQYFIECNVKGYDEINHKGEVREITVKEVKDNLLITVVTLGNQLKRVDRLIEILKEKIKFNFSLFQNVNREKTNVVFGDEYKLLYGSKEYSSEMLGIRYKVGVQSFMQVNTSVCKKLYSEVRDLVDADQFTTVIDAYSGAGLMTALLSVKAKKAIGVEIIKEAVDIANELAKTNGLQDKISNYNGKCEELLPSLIKEEKSQGNKTTLVLDPPRKGVDLKVIKAINESQIDKIVYVSCLPSTLARDVGLIVGTLEEVNGEIVKAKEPKERYEVKMVKTFDMFPQTKHVETLVCMTRKG